MAVNNNNPKKFSNPTIKRLPNTHPEHCSITTEICGEIGRTKDSPVHWNHDRKFFFF